MSVRVRPYRNGRWQVDVRLMLPDGSKFRERKVSGTSKSAAQRWGQDRERHVLINGVPQPAKEVPTFAEFAPRFVQGHGVANRLKPSSIAAQETILRVHLIPLLGNTRLDQISSELIQHLKMQLVQKAPKTVNNVLAVLSVLLRKATEWGVIERPPCSIKLVAAPKTSMAFYEPEEFELLVEVARRIDSRTYLAVLLGGEAGLRCGEMIALEWSDVDLVGKPQLCVGRSDWKGHVTAPKGGRIRHVPLSARLASALREHRHLRSSRVLCLDDGRPLTRQMVQNRMRLAARRSGCRKAGVHILRHTFCTRLAMRGASPVDIQHLAGHAQLTMTQRYMHHSPSSLDAAIRLLDVSSRGNRGATTAG